MRERIPVGKKWLNGIFLKALKSGVDAGDFVQVKLCYYKLSAQLKKNLAQKAKTVALKDTPTTWQTPLTNPTSTTATSTKYEKSTETTALKEGFPQASGSADSPIVISEGAEPSTTPSPTTNSKGQLDLSSSSSASPIVICDEEKTPPVTLCSPNDASLLDLSSCSESTPVAASPTLTATKRFLPANNVTSPANSTNAGDSGCRMS